MQQKPQHTAKTGTDTPPDQPEQDQEIVIDAEVVEETTTTKTDPQAQQKASQKTSSEPEAPVKKAGRVGWVCIRRAGGLYRGCFRCTLW